VAKRIRWSLALACVVGLLAGPGRAAQLPPPSSDEAQSALCSAAVQAAERQHGLPPGLLGSIAKVESGRPVGPEGEVRPWPWTIDADGIDYFFGTRAEAVAWARQGLAHGVKLLDAGCLQVNLQYHPAAFRSLEEAFDPAVNADYAARFLRALAAEANGDWTIATGLYHSHTPYLADAYREEVAAVGAGIVSGIGGPEPLYARALRQGTLRLMVGSRGVLLVHTHRQPSARPQKPKSACQVAAVLAPLLAAPPRVSGCRLVARKN
jgi:hypothetical protein